MNAAKGLYSAREPARPTESARASYVSSLQSQAVTSASVALTTSVSAGMPAVRLPRSPDAAPARSQSLTGAELRRRLNRAWRNTFYELTGLHLHVRWHPRAGEGQSESFGVLCPKARGRRARLPDWCQTCLRKRWPCVGNDQRAEKRFAGLCGALNYSACVRALGQTWVTLTVQQPGPVSSTSRQTFFRALHLMRMVLRDLQATPEAVQTCRGSPSLTTSTACRDQPKGCQPAATQIAVQPFPSGWGAGSAVTSDAAPAACPFRIGRKHSQLLAQRMLDYIHENYTHPFQLADLAASVQLRPTYASTLFSINVGVTFHHYLEQVRLAKAKDLLRDPVTRVAQVAYAVGFINPNHFRNVFTAHVGLPPSVWRDIPLPAPSSAASLAQSLSR